MSVDVLTLPLSRFFAGAYIPPSFERAWARGDVAEVERTDGSVETFAKGTPIGGAGADDTWKTWQDTMPKYVATLPYDIAQLGWNETFDGDPPAWDIDHVAFGALLDDARRILEKPPSLFKRMIGQFTDASHLVNAHIFVDKAFDKPFQKGAAVFGSLSTLEAELQRLAADTEGHDDVLNVLRKGVQQARTLQLPLLFDL